jgi:hypothetical protein
MDYGGSKKEEKRFFSKRRKKEVKNRIKQSTQLTMNR